MIGVDVGSGDVVDEIVTSTATRSPDRRRQLLCLTRLSCCVAVVVGHPFSCCLGSFPVWESVLVRRLPFCFIVMDESDCRWDEPSKKKGSS